MKRTSIILAAAVLALGLAPRAMAQKTLEGVKASATETLTATVQAVDSTKRMLTVKGPEGNVVSFHVSDAVKRLAEIKVGDKINVKYTESVSFKVLKPGAQPGVAEGAAVAAGAGAKPSGVAVSKTTAVVNVTAIDKAAPSITVKNAEGESHTFKVEHPENLETVKVGDSISVTYSETLAIDVTAPAK